MSWLGSSSSCASSWEVGSRQRLSSAARGQHRDRRVSFICYSGADVFENHYFMISLPSLPSVTLCIECIAVAGYNAALLIFPLGSPPMLRISQEALTFDDVLLIPGYSEVLPKDVSLKTRLTRGIELNIPLLSAAMDTVTEARLAIAMAQEGGIGIIHKNMTIEQQAAEVRKVKKFEAGVVKDPITIEADATVRDLFELTRQNNISGVPVLSGGDLVGIVTSRDVRFENRLDALVRDVMTPKERLVTVKEGADKETVRELLHKHRIEKVLIVDDAFTLKGMMTVKDIEKAKAYPLASKDDQGRLRVGAAVGTGADTGDRVAALVNAGVDVIIVDTAHAAGDRQRPHHQRDRRHLPRHLRRVEQTASDHRVGMIPQRGMKKPA
ncbi:UNVERIFIED_CONTAM: guaB [Trichonephila clavipes]